MSRILENSRILQVLRLNLVLLTLAGCQSVPPFADSRLLDDQSFQYLWNIYSRCRSSVDPEAMREDVYQLGGSARRLRQVNKASFLPEVLAQMVEDIPPRISVDLEAMTAACAIRAAQSAEVTRRSHMARELYRLVLSGPWTSLSNYYVVQARSGLTLLERNHRDIQDISVATVAIY